MNFQNCFLCVLCFIARGSNTMLISFPFTASHALGVSVGSGGWKDTEWGRQNSRSFSTMGLKGRAHLWPLLPIGLLPAVWAPTLCSDHRNGFYKFPQAMLIPRPLSTDLDSVLLVGEHVCLLRCLGHLGVPRPLQGQPLNHKAAAGVGGFGS